MQRSSKCGRNETWYYYTFYNSYDDEQREYRYEPHTKRSVWIQPQPLHYEERRQQSKQNSLPSNNYTRYSNDSTFKNSDSIGESNESTDFSCETSVMDKERTSDPNINQEQDLLLDQSFPPLLSFQNHTITQMIMKYIYNLFETVRNNDNNIINITPDLYQYEQQLISVLTLPYVATAMLLNIIILLILIMY